MNNVGAERQQAEVVANEDIEASVSNNAKATDNLKPEKQDAITRTEITFKQGQTRK